MTQNESDTFVVHQALLDIKNKEGALTPIDDIKIINDYLPKDQAKKIRIIKRIKEMLPESVIEKLDPKDKKLVRELLPDQLPDILKPQDLPRLLKIPFQELDGTIGKIVHAYPKFEHGEFWDGNEVIRFTQRLREAIKRSGVGAVVAGQAPISADLIASIKDDGPKATVFALCSVIILVLFIFPSFKQARSVLGSLLLGVLWMLAIMGAFKLKINFLNFIALPITFGIGVDYAVNIFSRFNSDGGKSLQKAIEHSGGAVALCSYTTIVGYGSLLIASNQAFVSFGRLAIIGEFTCLFAAIIALPAAWKFFKQNQ
jgi:predicted RND superfamily exporter protein